MVNDDSRMNQQFGVASISRRVIESLTDKQFAESLSDEEMSAIASKLRDRYFPDRFYEDLLEILKE